MPGRLCFRPKINLQTRISQLTSLQVMTQSWHRWTLRSRTAKFMKSRKSEPDPQPLLIMCKSKRSTHLSKSLEAADSKGRKEFDHCQVKGISLEISLKLQIIFRRRLPQNYLPGFRKSQRRRLFESSISWTYTLRWLKIGLKAEEENELIPFEEHNSLKNWSLSKPRKLTLLWTQLKI